jgi:transcriptional regulator with XRE-family HTH domain
MVHSDVVVVESRVARLGARLRLRRWEQGLTRAELAASAGLTPGEVEACERTGRVASADLWRLCQALDLSVDWLFSDAAVAASSPDAGPPGRTGGPSRPARAH